MPGYLLGQLLGIPSYREKTTTLVVSAQETLYKAIVVLLTFTAIIWMSIFLYAIFYYSYMPAISHTRPVHLQFSRSCEKRNSDGMCTFPTASVTLTKRQQLLMVGQPYRVVLEMEMPESPSNQNLGMFMVCANLKDKEANDIAESCRSAMLHYKSYLHHMLSTFFFSPFLLSGSSEEKQNVQVELFTNFEEDHNRPITEAIIQIQSHHVEIYHTSLKIHAHFTGLRYFMFHWPLLSAVIGVATNLFFLSVIAFLSWFKFFSPKQVTYSVSYDSNQAKTLEERRAMAKQRLMKERGKLLNQKIVVPSSDAPSNLATKKEDLDTAAPLDSITVNPKSAATTKILTEQKPKVVDNSDSDNVSVNENEKIVTGDRKSDEEFVVVSDLFDKTKAGLEEDSAELSHKQEFDDVDKAKRSLQSEGDDKENKPCKEESEGAESDSQTATVRHRSAARKPQ